MRAVHSKKLYYFRNRSDMSAAFSTTMCRTTGPFLLAAIIYRRRREWLAPSAVTAVEKRRHVDFTNLNNEQPTHIAENETMTPGSQIKEFYLNKLYTPRVTFLPLFYHAFSTFSRKMYDSATLKPVICAGETYGRLQRKIPILHIRLICRNFTESFKFFNMRRNRAPPQCADSLTPRSSP